MKNRIVLSRKDVKLYKSLKTIPRPSLLALVVDNFLADPKVSRFIDLKQTFLDQMRDDPMNTKKALGKTICENLQQKTSSLEA